jgi:hypothetical protein
MKNRFKIIALAMTLGLILGLANVTIPQPPPPPAGHGNSGNAVPGGGMAPVGSGLILLLGMGAAYGSRKLFKAWKNLED